MNLVLPLLLGAGAPAVTALPACDLGPSAIVAHRLADLPPPVAGAVRRGFGASGIAEAGAPFNATDVLRPGLPQRRFVRAYRVAAYWIIWYDMGGIVSDMRTVAFRRMDSRGGAAQRYQMEPDTVFAGEPCRASKALLSGVRRAGLRA